MRLIIILLGMLFLACKHPPFSRNFTDKHFKKQGVHVLKYPNGKTYMKGRYVNGIPKGRWKYYYKSGHLMLTEKYRKKIIYTKYYQENGLPDLTGKAELIINKDTSLYQWQGPWYKYDSAGNIIKIITYRNGQIIGEKTIK